jgi:hypothetical protein
MSLFTSTICDIELRLYDAHSPTDQELAHFIRCLPALERFSLHVDYYSGSDVTRSLKCLRPAQSTLQYLCLTGNHYYSDLHIIPHDQTLADFERLEIIDMSTTGLWIEKFKQLDYHGHEDWNNGILESKFAEFFPSHLRQLTLRQTTITTILHAFNLLKIKHESFPQFELLHMVMVVNAEFHAFRHTVEELRGLGEECGVEVVVSLT